MKRRDFLTAGTAACWPVASRAQSKTFRVGLLASNTTVPGGVDAFREALRQRGYVEGNNLVLDVRWPKASMDEVQDIAIDLVRATRPVDTFAPDFIKKYVNYGASVRPRSFWFLRQRRAP